MPISAKFYLIVNSSRFNTIVPILKGLGFKVSQVKQIDSQDPISGSTDIICTMILKDSEISGALNLAHTLGEIEGVIKTVPMYGKEEEKILQWYRKPIIPISISSAITFFTVYEALRSSPPIDILNILTTAGIPTIVTFFSQILYRYFFHEHTM